MQTTIESTLQETTSQAIDELKDILKEYWIENIDKEEICLSNDIDYDGRFHEMIDSSVPIYTHELKSNYFMHEDELEQALEDSGCYGNGDKIENRIAVCHYFYIEQACWSWWHDNYQEIEDAITERRDELLERADAIEQASYNRSIERMPPSPTLSESVAIVSDIVTKHTLDAEQELKDFINNMEI